MSVRRHYVENIASENGFTLAYLFCTFTSIACQSTTLYILFAVGAQALSLLSSYVVLLLT